MTRCSRGLAPKKGHSPLGALPELYYWFGCDAVTQAQILSHLGGVEEEMHQLSYKVRISILWLLAIVGFFAYRTLAVSEGATEVSVLGNDDFATYLLVAMGLAFLSLVLPSRLDRLTNIIAGSIFGVAQAIMFVDGITAYPVATFNLMTGATVVIMASIILFAYRWPKELGTGSSERMVVDEALTDEDLASLPR